MLRFQTEGRSQPPSGPTSAATAPAPSPRHCVRAGPAPRSLLAMKAAGCLGNQSVVLMMRARGIPDHGVLQNLMTSCGQGHRIHLFGFILSLSSCLMQRGKGKQGTTQRIRNKNCSIEDGSCREGCLTAHPSWQCCRGCSGSELSL